MRLAAPVDMLRATVKPSLPAGRPRVGDGPMDGDGPSSVADTTSNLGLDELLALVAPTRISVVLVGETGAGKEVAARAIHAMSDRRDGPFVTLDCGAASEELLEAELLGRAAPGREGRPSLLEAAHGGTLFLDEVSALPLSAQTKLLRVLELREITRTGSHEPKSVDVRFVAATNADLEAMVAADRLRRDLFYRLDGMTIVVPPLRRRRDEIPRLAAQFVEAACARTGSASRPITEAALRELASRPWPGNVRELRNVIDRAVLLARGEPIGVAHLRTDRASWPPPDSSRHHEPDEARAPGGRAGLREDVMALERRRIVEALEQSAGNQTTAARLLGVSRRTLVGRLDAFDLPRPRRPR